APLGGDLASEDQEPVLGLDPLLFQDREDLGILRDVEDPLHHGPCLAGTDDIGGGTLTQEKRERPHDDRLPRAGLPGEDVEPWRQTDRQPVDDREVLDAQFDEHTPVYPHTFGQFNAGIGRDSAVDGGGSSRRAFAASDPPVQLPAQRGNEALAGKTDERDTCLPPSDDDLVTRREKGALLSIERQT